MPEPTPTPGTPTDQPVSTPPAGAAPTPPASPPSPAAPAGTTPQPAPAPAAPAGTPPVAPPGTQTAPPAPAPAPAPTTPPALKQEDTVDFWKKRHASSSQEAHKLSAKVKQYESRELQEPTDADLKKVYPNWDDLMPSEKTLAKKALIAERSAQAANQAVQRVESRMDRDNELQRLYSLEPSLREKSMEFGIYANQEANKDVPLQTLADAFLHRTADPTPAPPPLPNPAPIGLEPGTPGAAPAKDGGKKDDISDDEALKILSKQPKRARKMILEGKL